MIPTAISVMQILQINDRETKHFYVKLTENLKRRSCPPDPAAAEPTSVYYLLLTYIQW